VPLWPAVKRHRRFRPYLSVFPARNKTVKRHLHQLSQDVANSTAPPRPPSLVPRACENDVRVDAISLLDTDIQQIERMSKPCRTSFRLGGRVVLPDSNRTPVARLA
jgi:hypothetical protein